MSLDELREALKRAQVLRQACYHVANVTDEVVDGCNYHGYPALMVELLMTLAVELENGCVSGQKLLTMGNSFAQLIDDIEDEIQLVNEVSNN